MTVKFIASISMTDLEKEVNDFIKEKYNVIDIKYSSAKLNDCFTEYSAMIIMK